MPQQQTPTPSSQAAGFWRPRPRLTLLAAACGLLIAGCGGGDGAEPSGRDYAATINWTPYGVPHITAKDWGGVGLGMGYSQSSQTICELFDRVLVSSGQQALYRGPGEDNAHIGSDLYHKWLKLKVDKWLAEAPGASANSPSAQARELIAGWTAGINKYLEEVGGTNGIADARCKGQPWIKPLSLNDAWMYQATVWKTVGSTTNQEGIEAAIPPSPVPSQTCAAPKAATLAALKTRAQPSQAVFLSQAQVRPGADPFDTPDAPSGSVGSNAFGLGKLATKNGSGALLTNPHWYWEGPNRFYRSHITIPGEVNVIGAGFVNNPWLLLGHNENVGWSLTLSTARRAGFWGLSLHPDDPTKYLYEGAYEPMTVDCVSSDVKNADGSTRTVRRAFYSTRWGPVVHTETFPWTQGKAYAARDAGEGLRMMDQFFAQARAKSVQDLAAAMNKYAAYGTNITSADSSGKAWYGDVGHVPNISAAQVAGVSGSAPGACLDKDLGLELWQDTRYPVFDGSKAQCAWKNDPGAVPGLAGLATAPNVFRDDYVAQMNDSYWLTNPAAPMTGYLRIFGEEKTERSLRGRMGLKIVADRLAGTDGLGAPKFDLETVKKTMLSNQVMSAELAREALVRHCAQAGYRHKGVDLRPACDVLAAWDGTYNVSSRGAVIWRRFFANKGLVYAVPFDPARGATTPNTLDTSSPKVLDALVAAIQDLQAANIALNAPLGTVHGITRNGKYIPMHGGNTADGTFNQIQSPERLQANVGYTPDKGSSFIMAVEWGPGGVKSDAILTYSQSTNPASPHFTDQTEMFSRREWDRNYFTTAEVEAATVRKETVSAKRSP